MKNNNFITYYSALVLWELYFLDKCLTRVIAYPLNHLSAYFYDRIFHLPHVCVICAEHHAAQTP